MTLALDLLERSAWLRALADARRGDPKMLAKMVVRELPPDDLRQDVERIIANPVAKRPKTSRARAFNEREAMAVRVQFWCLTGRLNPRAVSGPTCRMMSDTSALSKLALQTGRPVGTIRDVVEERKTYAVRK